MTETGGDISTYLQADPKDTGDDSYPWDGADWNNPTLRVLAKSQWENALLAGCSNPQIELQADTPLLFNNRYYYLKSPLSVQVAHIDYDKCEALFEIEGEKFTIQFPTEFMKAPPDEYIT